MHDISAGSNMPALGRVIIDSASAFKQLLKPGVLRRPFPHDDPLEWHGYWSQELDRAMRRQHISALARPARGMLFENALDDAQVSDPGSA
jgi:hypothetical protein